MSEKEQQDQLFREDESSPPPSAQPAVTSASSAKQDSLFRLFLLFLMAAQNTSVVLLSRYTRAGVNKEDLYVINDMVMVSEMAKVRFLKSMFGTMGVVFFVILS